MKGIVYENRDLSGRTAADELSGRSSTAFGRRAFVCAAVQRSAADGGQCGSGSGFAGHSAAGAARACSFYKVFTCCAAVAAAYGVPGLRNFVQLCVWYLLLNLLLCGAVLLPGVQSANLCVYLPLSPGRLLLCCGAVLAVLRGVLFCFGRAGTRCFAAVLELEGAVLSVQAFCDTGFSVQDPLTGQAVVLVYYPAVRSALPPELRTFLDRYFACGTAPPPELRVRLVPCTTIAGHCVLPAVPAKALRTSKGSAAGILAAFCRPETQQPWTALLGSELAVQLGIR